MCYFEVLPSLTNVEKMFLDIMGITPGSNPYDELCSLAELGRLLGSPKRFKRPELMTTAEQEARQHQILAEATGGLTRLTDGQMAKKLQKVFTHAVPGPQGEILAAVAIHHYGLGCEAHPIAGASIESRAINALKMYYLELPLIDIARPANEAFFLAEMLGFDPDDPKYQDVMDKSDHITDFLIEQGININPDAISDKVNKFLDSLPENLFLATRLTYAIDGINVRRDSDFVEGLSGIAPMMLSPLLQQIYASRS